jgi:hypothetical protein
MVPKILDGELLKALAGPGREWTVSMEQAWRMADSGFLIRNGPERRTEEAGLIEKWLNETTPDDIVALDYCYCPAEKAPIELLRCMDTDESKVVKKFHGREVIVLFGGLDGTIRYQGVGLTPLGKEPEAAVGQMLASAAAGNIQHPTGIVEIIKQTAGEWES